MVSSGDRRRQTAAPATAVPESAHQRHPRPVQAAQWQPASARGQYHPVAGQCQVVKQYLPAAGRSFRGPCAFRFLIPEPLLHQWAWRPWQTRVLLPAVFHPVDLLHQGPWMTVRRLQQLDSQPRQTQEPWPESHRPRCVLLNQCQRMTGQRPRPQVPATTPVTRPGQVVASLARQVLQQHHSRL